MIRLALFLLGAVPLTMAFSVLALAGGLFGASKRWFDWIHRSWSRLLLRMAGVRVVVAGEEALTRDEPQVLVCNHQSLLDIPVLFAALPLSLRFVAKIELTRVPVFAGAMRRAGHVFVDRGDRAQAIEAMRRAAERMRGDGLTLGLFPEGTRSRDGKLRSFKKGAFALATETGTAIVPVAIEGGAAVLPEDGGRLLPGTIHVCCGERIELAGREAVDRDAILERSRDSIARMLERIRTERG